jgi:O-antigen/teichoic acid export membrane protein
MVRRLFSSQLRTNMTSGVAMTVINMTMMVVAYPLYLHFLGYDKYGVWLVLATVLTFAQMGNLGMEPAVTKLVAEDHGRGDINGVEHYATTALALLCVSGIVALVLILTFRSQIVALFKLNDENAGMVLWLLPYIGVLSIYVFIVQVFNATLSGLGRMDLSNYIQSTGRILAVIVAAVLLYTGRGIESLRISSIVSYVLIHIASIICIRRISQIRFLRLSSFDIQRCKRLLHFGGTVLGSSILGMLVSPFNKLILARYAGVSTVPIYEIAYNGSMQIRALGEAGFRALMPEISRIGASMADEAKTRIAAINKKAVKGVLIGSIPLFGGLFIFADPLLRLWLGNGFVAPLPWAFRIMLIAGFASLLGVPAFYMLMGMGEVRIILEANIVQSMTNTIMLVAITFFCSKVEVNMVCICCLSGMSMGALYLILNQHVALRKFDVHNGNS